jgi:hypothetical protein
MPDVSHAPETVDTLARYAGGAGVLGVLGTIITKLFKRDDRVFTHTIPRLQETFKGERDLERAEHREELKAQRDMFERMFERAEVRHAEDRRMLAGKIDALTAEVARLQGATHG